MSEPRSGQLSVADIMATAALVDLPLSDADAGEVAELLSAWMPAAVALSTRMQSVQELMPASTFDPTVGMAPHETTAAAG